MLGEFASRFTGSSDLYQSNSRLPHASINYITAHDGFTLHDLVSYNGKHNEANQHDSTDGDNNNRSWNCGAEGPTDDINVQKFRSRQKRNFLTTLLLSQGAPMILAGDEFGRTQNGNNNAYCQDNETSWVNWETMDKELLAFCQKLIHFRIKHPVFRRRRWFEGRPLHGSELRDIEWFSVDGIPMAQEDWGKGYIKSLGIFLNGKTIPNPNPRGDPITDDSFYLMFNTHNQALEFTLPNREWGEQWVKVLDTASGWVESPQKFNSGDKITIEEHSVLVFSDEKTET